MDDASWALQYLAVAARHVLLRDRSATVSWWQLISSHMSDLSERVPFALPTGCAPELPPPPVAQLVAAWWPGMSRAQLLNQA